IDDAKIVDPAAVDEWHGRIWHAKPLLKALYDRAVTNEDIVKYRLGERGGRVTIPVPNAQGDIVNVRQYAPGASGADKMKNMRGRGAARWFPEEQLKYDSIMVCGGEMKAIVAARQLNPHGVGAACVTQGEKLVPSKLMERLRGKQLYWCFDVDAAGM